MNVASSYRFATSQVNNFVHVLGSVQLAFRSLGSEAATSPIYRASVPKLAPPAAVQQPTGPIATVQAAKPRRPPRRPTESATPRAELAALWRAATKGDRSRSKRLPVPSPPVDVAGVPVPSLGPPVDVARASPPPHIERRPRQLPG